MSLIALHLGEGEFDVVEPLRRLLGRIMADEETSARGAGLRVVSAASEAWNRTDHVDLFEETGYLRRPEAEESPGDVLAEVVDEAMRANSMRTSDGASDRPIVVVVPIVAAESMPLEAIERLNRWFEEVESHFHDFHTNVPHFLPEADDLRRLPWVFVERPPETWPDALFEQTETLSRLQRTPLHHHGGRAAGGRRGWAYMAEQLETELTALAALSRDRERLRRACPALSRSPAQPKRVHRIHSARLEIPLHTRAKLDVLDALTGGGADPSTAAPLPSPDELEALAEACDASFDERLPRFEGLVTAEAVDERDYYLPDGDQCPAPDGLAEAIRRVGPHSSEPGRRWPEIVRQEWSIVAPNSSAPQVRERAVEALSHAYDDLLSTWIEAEIEKIDEQVWGAPASDEMSGVEHIEHGLERAFERADSTREGIARVFRFLSKLREMLGGLPSEEDSSSELPDRLGDDFDPDDTLPDDWGKRERELLERGESLPSRGAILLEHAAILGTAAAAGLLTAPTGLGPILSGVFGLAAAGGLYWRRRRDLRQYLGDDYDDPKSEAPRSWAAQREAWIEAFNEHGIDPLLEEVEHRVERARRAALSDVRTRVATVESRLRTELEGLVRFVDERRRLLRERLERFDEAGGHTLEATSFLPLDVGETEAGVEPDALFDELAANWRGVFNVGTLPEPVDVAAYERAIDALVDRELEAMLTPTPEQLDSHLEDFVRFVTDPDELSGGLAPSEVSTVGRERLVFGGDDESMRRWEASAESLVPRSKPHAPGIDDHVVAPSEDSLGTADVAWGCRIRTIQLDRNGGEDDRRR